MENDIIWTEWLNSGGERGMRDYIILASRLSLEDVQEKNSNYPGNHFSKKEKKFAKTFIELGYDVYREPEIRNCNHLADFYICNPALDKDVVVEITDLENFPPKKKEQIKDISNHCDFYNIPFVVLDSNGQKEVRENPNSLFEM